MMFSLYLILAAAEVTELRASGGNSVSRLHHCDAPIARRGDSAHDRDSRRHRRRPRVVTKVTWIYRKDFYNCSALGLPGYSRSIWSYCAMLCCVMRCCCLCKQSSKRKAFLYGCVCARSREQMSNDRAQTQRASTSAVYCVVSACALSAHSRRTPGWCIRSQRVSQRTKLSFAQITV